MAKTFALAIEEAAKLHPAAEPLIVHAALLAPEPIPLFLFSEARENFGEPLASVLADDGLDEAVAALRAFALIDREAIPDEREPRSRPTASACTGWFARSRRRGAKATAREDARRALVEALAAVYPGRRLQRSADLAAGAAARCARAGAGRRRCCAAERGREERAADLLDRLASYRHGALAAYAQARPLFERALAIREKALGPEHPDTATSLNNLAFLLKDQGDLAGGRPLYERALAIREKALGPEHPDTATSLNNLARLLQDQGDLAGARPLLERALAIYEKALGPEHPDTAISLNNLACPASDPGRSCRSAAAL